MPPKRKAAAKTKPAAKKAKTEIEIVKTALKKGPSFRKKVHKLDKEAEGSLSGGSVVDDFDCMLNQTNISFNNNKYYIIQLVNWNNKFYVWTRWGRVGESGQNLKIGPFTTKEEADKEFGKKFTAKTSNKWENRNKFVPVKGKYTLLEMADDDDGETELKLQQTATNNSLAVKTDQKYQPSKLDVATQHLIDLIFQTDMFKHAMAELKLDTKKLPLGKLSKPQIAKGFTVLEQLQEAITKGGAQASGPRLNELSSEFYTIIPHSFGRTVPPTIKTLDEVREKLDMLLVLSDIESTQALLNQTQKKASNNSNASALPPNPLDDKYEMLNTNLELLQDNSKEYKIIDEYVKTTKNRHIKIRHIWRVDRAGEDNRFRVHKALANRKLLWHGTNIAVVAAILKSGLRIMPHSGGRVGRGIYFASENGKSAGYVSCAPNRLGVMFLNEVALGKENFIRKDNCSLTQPPSGYDSVVAEGKQEPDTKYYKEMELDGVKVIVPCGKPVQRDFSSSFHQSEYLVYKESQARIRYLLLCEF